MPENKPLKIEFSKQSKMFIESLDEKERGEFLDILEKLATGELVGELVSMDDLEPETRQQIAASMRETRHKPEKV